MKNYLGLLSAVLCLASSAAPHIEETLTLENGWNAVYIESTPDQAACEDFFRELPVIGAACYRSDADAATAQYDASGEEIVQKPVVYLQWIRGETTASTLRSISGGSTYLLFATNAATYSFRGVPTVPRMNWRKVSSTETNEFLNLAGVSFAPNQGTVAANYFGEGPYGTVPQGQVIYGIGGTDANGPELKKMSAFGKPLQVTGGKAYAMTATKAGEWPGVIGIDGFAEVVFGQGAYGSVKIRNRGTKPHVFQIKVTNGAAGDSTVPLPGLLRRLPRVDALSGQDFTNVEVDVAWEVALEPDAVTEQVFSIDRSKLTAAGDYGSILEITDLGDSQMRVRLPMTAQAATSAVKYPAGLWAGSVQLEAVSTLTNGSPVRAGGQMRFNMLVHVDGDGKVRALQRVVLAVDTNGEVRLFRDLKDVPATCRNVRRASSVVMSVDTPVVEAESGSSFGSDVAFAWNVDAEARDNPFRHAWHPDHDGRRPDDNAAHLPSGDDPESYKNPIKPELWSVSNRVVFSWHELNDPGRPVYFPYKPDETTSGYVTWSATGLIASRPVNAMGIFMLKRVVAAEKLED